MPSFHFADLAVILLSPERQNFSIPQITTSAYLALARNAKIKQSVQSYCDLHLEWKIQTGTTRHWLRRMVNVLFAEPQTQAGNADS
jgi:hypothetical protein